MAMRIDETISGVKADLAIKIFGDDFHTLDTLGQQVLRSISTVRGPRMRRLRLLPVLPNCRSVRTEPHLLAMD